MTFWDFANEVLKAIAKMVGLLLFFGAYLFGIFLGDLKQNGGILTILGGFVLYVVWSLFNAPGAIQ